MYHDPNSVPIVVRKGTGTYVPESTSFTDQTNVVRRVPRDHKNWQSVRYLSKRYKLSGGIRTPYFICLNNPIKGRS